MNKKNLSVSVLALSLVLGGTVIGAQSASASENEHPFARKISERFGLNQDDVKNFLDADREERQVQMRERFEERLTESVESGELTEDQKNLIIAKKATLQSERETYRESGDRPSEDDREQHRIELESWAQENGIDMKYFIGGNGRGGYGPSNDE